MNWKSSIRARARDLLSRVTGFTIPIIGAGVSWNPSSSEREIARRLLVFLNDRRVLAYTYNGAHDYIIKSVFDIRHRLVSDLEQIDSSSELADSIEIMLVACRDFLDKTEQSQADSTFFMHWTEQFGSVITFHSARIAAHYGLYKNSRYSRRVPF